MLPRWDGGYGASARAGPASETLHDSGHTDELAHPDPPAALITAIRARLENRPDPVLYNRVERLVSMISLAISA
jgi:hypothetical protein